MFGTVISSSPAASPLFCAQSIQDLTVTHCYVERVYNPHAWKNYSENPIWPRFRRLN
jgi:hypothetical protein